MEDNGTLAFAPHVKKEEGVVPYNGAATVLHVGKTYPVEQFDARMRYISEAGDHLKEVNETLAAKKKQWETGQETFII